MTEAYDFSLMNINTCFAQVDIADWRRFWSRKPERKKSGVCDGPHIGNPAPDLIVRFFGCVEIGADPWPCHGCPRYDQQKWLWIYYIQV